MRFVNTMPPGVWNESVKYNPDALTVPPATHVGTAVDTSIASPNGVGEKPPPS